MRAINIPFSTRRLPARPWVHDRIQIPRFLQEATAVFTRFNIREVLSANPIRDILQENDERLNALVDTSEAP